MASYEAIRFQRLDLFSVTLRQIGAYINRMHLEDAIGVSAQRRRQRERRRHLTVGTAPSPDTRGRWPMTRCWTSGASSSPTTMNTLLVGSDVMLAMLKLDEFQNP